MPTIARTLELAQVAGYLAADYKDKGALFGGYGRPSGVNQSALIYAVFTILNKVYTEQPDREGLQAVSDYLYELLQKFAFKAANVVDGGGGGSVTPITPTVLPSPYYFLVDGSSFIADGETTKQFPASWQGYNMVFARNGITQTDVTSEPTYFTWDSETAIMTISPAAVTTELFAIIPT